MNKTYTSWHDMIVCMFHVDTVSALSGTYPFHCKYACTVLTCRRKSVHIPTGVLVFMQGHLNLKTQTYWCSKVCVISDLAAADI